MAGKVGKYVILSNYGLVKPTIVNTVLAQYLLCVRRNKAEIRVLGASSSVDAISYKLSEIN
jgi:hypothetical protein